MARISNLRCYIAVRWWWMAIAVITGRSPEPVLIQEYQRLISEEIELSCPAEDDVNLPAQPEKRRACQSDAGMPLSPEHEES